MPSMDTVKFESLYCLFKGEPGTRKSSAALSFPGPIYFFDFDGKMDALRMPMRAWGLDPKNIEFDTYKDWDTAKKKLEGFQVNCKYKTLVIDSITSCADAINRQTLKFKAGKGEGKTVGTINVNSIEDFNAEDSALKELIALTKDIHSFHKVNIILIGHIIQKEVKGPNNTTHMSRMLVTAGKGIAQKIPAYCSEIYHFNVETGMVVGTGGQYGLKTTHTGDDFARTSLPLPPDILFGNEQLYQGWIAPAMVKINEKQTPVVKL
jgi:hypothetical protein